jgi:two-component system sensor histidine kinase KdpD
MLAYGTERSIRGSLAFAGVLAASLVAASLVVAALESALVGISDASLVYVVPVVVVATRFGTRPGVATAVAAFLVYDYFFTQPRYSFVVADPREWLELILFLFVALVVGRLSALGTERAALAERRAGESQAQFAVSRHLATSELDVAIPAILERIAEDARLARAWITAEGPTGSRVLADTQPGDPAPGSGIVDTLVRTPGDEPARWIRAHAPTRGPRPPVGTARLRVRIEADGGTLGSLWATHAGGQPGREATRLLALAADQIGLALHREQLRRAGVDAEVSRRSDTLKSALLRSVSHDLRTPLAGIRAAAGSLLDPGVAFDREAVVRSATEIDAAAGRLDRLVRGLLDLGRIESGLLRPEFEPFDLGALVEAAVDRVRPTLGERPVELDVPDDMPPVNVDGLLFDEVLANLLENVARHVPPPAPCRVRASLAPDGLVELVVEDGGPGVSRPALDRLFAAFSRAEGPIPDRGGGPGIGLAVVQGFAQAMGIDVSASASPLGGLAVILRVPTAARPPVEAAP